MFPRSPVMKQMIGFFGGGGIRAMQLPSLAIQNASSVLSLLQNTSSVLSLITFLIQQQKEQYGAQ